MLVIMTELKRVNKTDALSLDELMALSAGADGLQAQYVKHQTEVPTWLSEVMRILTRAINDRKSDTVAERRTRIAQELANLETPAQKRARLEAELAQLDGVQPVTK